LPNQMRRATDTTGYGGGSWFTQSDETRHRHHRVWWKGHGLPDQMSRSLGIEVFQKRLVWYGFEKDKNTCGLR
jgi:hypothetical protein